MSYRRAVLMVHAHPDDETTKGGATAAWLAASGVRVVLVTCTDGSAGEVTDPALVGDRPLAEVRSEELAAAASIMGFAQVYELGFADSGVEAEVDGGFATIDLDGVVAELLGVIELEQPDVVVTYEPAYAAGHPDHLRCHNATAAAFALTCTQPDGPRKLYGTRFSSKARVMAMHEWMVARNLDSPYERALDRLADLPEEQITTRLPVGEHTLTARRALREHRTQIAHDHRWFYSIPDDDLVEVYPWEELELLATAPGFPARVGIETDLFEGLGS